MTDLRELLILALAFLILVSLLRAVYVIHRRRKGQIRLSIDKSIARLPPEDEDLENSELPNGGARVVDSAANAESRRSLAARIDGDVQDAADGEVPILLDVAAAGAVDAETAAAADAESAASLNETAPDSATETRKPQRRKSWKDQIRETHHKDGGGGEFDTGAVSITAGERIGEEHIGVKRAPSGVAKVAATEAAAQQAASQGPEESQDLQTNEPRTLDEQEQPQENDSRPAEAKAEAAAVSATAGPEAAQAEPPDSDPQSDSEAPSEAQIIAIHVAAPEGEQFTGRELWDFLLAAGLRHDKTGILSKTDADHPQGGPVFRVANMVNPGTFDADEVDQFQTPGVSLFMLLPTPINNLLAFEQMLALARRLAETLGGDVLDGQRQALSSAGTDEIRKCIRGFADENRSGIKNDASGPASMGGRF